MAELVDYVANIDRPRGTLQVCAMVFCGADTSDGHYIGLGAFYDWLKPALAPFDGNATVLASSGFWKGKLESTRVVLLLGPDTEGFRASVRGLAEGYKTAFNQEAVSRAILPAQFALDCWPHGPVSTYRRYHGEAMDGGREVLEHNGHVMGALASVSEQDDVDRHLSDGEPILASGRHDKGYPKS